MVPTSNTPSSVWGVVGAMCWILLVPCSGCCVVCQECVRRLSLSSISAWPRKSKWTCASVGGHGVFLIPSLRPPSRSPTHGIFLTVFQIIPSFSIAATLLYLSDYFWDYCIWAKIVENILPQHAFSGHCIFVNMLDLLYLSARF